MKVQTNSEKVKKSRRMLIELLMSDHPSPCARQRKSGDCELETLARIEGITQPRFPTRVSPRGQDDSSLVISVDHEACILCDRCIRGCDEIRFNDVLGRRGKGYNAGIAFDISRPMGNSSCVSCGECMVSCPTGALTNKSVIQTVLPGGEPVAVAELKKLPFFQKVSGTFLELNGNAVIKRHFKAGEIICREGDYGSTAFYIIEGKVQIFLATPLAHVSTGGGATGFISKLTSFLTGADQRRPDTSHPRSIPCDASVDLPYDNPVAELGPGDLFGEMTCMNLYPRSATVRASTDCVMYEMLRNVLDVIQRNKTLRSELEANYRRRASTNICVPCPCSRASVRISFHPWPRESSWSVYLKETSSASRAISPMLSIWSASDSSRSPRNIPAATWCARISAREAISAKSACSPRDCGPPRSPRSITSNCCASTRR